jgi:hypothetical protein
VVGQRRIARGPAFGQHCRFHILRGYQQHDCATGWTNIHDGTPVMGTIAWDPGMAASSLSGSRADFSADAAHPISLTLTVGSYVFAGNPSTSHVTMYNGSFNISAYVPESAWPEGLDAKPVPGDSGWLYVNVYGSPGPISSLEHDLALRGQERLRYARTGTRHLSRNRPGRSRSGTAPPADPFARLKLVAARGGVAA